MAMVTADKLEDLVALRISPGEAQRAHGGFRSGVDHAHHVQRGHSRADFLSQHDLIRAGSAVACAAPGSLNDGPRHAFLGVPENHRSPGHDEIDEFVAIHIYDMRPFALSDEERITVNVMAGTDRAVHAPRDKFLRF